MKKLLLILCILFIAANAHAQNVFWASPTGTATWANCESGTPLTGTAACSLTEANDEILAGQTVNLRDGSYTSDNISPVHSGSSTISMITYQAYSTEIPIIEDLGGWTAGIGLSAIDYIKIDGITFQNLYNWVTIRAGSDFIEITNCTFTDDTGEMGVKAFLINGQCIGGSPYNCPSSHVWVHDSLFYRAGYVAPPPGCNDIQGIMTLGTDQVGDTTNHITLEDNTFYHGAHHLLEVRARYVIIRNNFFHNEGWMTNPGTCCKVGEVCPPFPYTCDDGSGMFGNRAIIIQDYLMSGDPANILLEGNRIGSAAIASDGNFGGSVTIGYANVITRYNDIYDSQEAGIYSRSSTAVAADLHIYNNTLYKNGSGPQCRKDSWTAMNQDGIECRGTGCTDPVIKNNIVYDSTASDIVTINAVNPILANNWITTDGDPLFVNADISDSTSTTVPDLSLLSNSGAINGGADLTKTVGGVAVPSNLLTVLDPWYFQDGTWGSALATVGADYIAVGTIGNVSQITSINYVTNEIVLVDALIWADDDPVWLYKKSDGDNILLGSAPDQGAHEFTGSAPGPGETYKLILIGSGSKIMNIGSGSQTLSIGQ